MRLLRVLRVVVAAGILLGLGHVLVHQVVGPEDRLFAFIYHRGPVQHLILVAAAFALVLLYSRCRQYVHDAARFRRFEAKGGTPPGPLGEALRKVGRFNSDYGPGAARRQVDRFQEDQSEVVHHGYDAIRFFVAGLPVLGLLGTMLGLSNALYGAFSQGFGPESVETFVSGLATALDTTVLAMVCAAPLFAWTAMQTQQESNLVDRYAEYLRQHFDLADIPDGDQGMYVIYAELCRLTKRIGQDAKAMFAELLGTSADAMRQTLGEAVQKHLADHHQSQLEAVRTVDREIAEQVSKAVCSISQTLQQQNRELAERVTRAVTENVAQPVQAAAEAIQDHSNHLGEQLPQMVSRAMADALAQATQLLDQRHTSLAERMTDQMGRLETTLRKRTPEEVIIRYQGNGAVH